MPVYNFKSIGAIPSAGDLVDIVLTRTQRRTPTVVHPGYKISRIRGFYIRKIKFTQQTISERLSAILSEFPRLNDIHPFYSDLCNTLYDRDHYKLALGQINAARGTVDTIARDMIRMVKYGDSLYRCKSLKRAALGRMCTVLKRQKSALAYLEEVRKHLGRLPALDPSARTLLMCGSPNVGKSSFMNKITRANVDVQPYAFTTKSLFVGHTDHRYLRWQIIDTPGLLDHPLEERNTIEMQAITALAHLTCAVLYFLDISENCGYTVESQCALFKSIRPLFVNKELIVVVNKVDVQPWDTLDAKRKAMVKDIVETTPNCTLMTMSNISEQGVSDVKTTACDRLLASRVSARVSSGKVDNVIHRLQVFHPAARDGTVRDAFIPQSVVQARADGRLGPTDDERRPKRSRTGYAPTVEDKSNDDGDDAEMDTNCDVKKTARDLMWKNGGPGVWAPDYREQYDLEDDSWRFDAIPEIVDGKNISDYIDADIDSKLAALEAEEEQLVAEEEAAAMGEDPESELDEEEEAAVAAIRSRRIILTKARHVNKSQNYPVVPRSIRGRQKDKHDDMAALTIKGIKSHLEDGFGINSSKVVERGRKRERSLDRRKEVENMDVDMTEDGPNGRGLSKGAIKRANADKKKKERFARNKSRDHSLPKEPFQMGLKDEDAVTSTKKKDRTGRRNWKGLSGEGDQRKSVHLVKWMNTGKKRKGTSYCR
mmetsp:Transcript_24874/g.57341  ORF Transcript_24874/g.57341 Transcript_24874/m.57341 type:complete len:711 (-) Transcript_24874:113-2245(-)